MNWIILVEDDYNTYPKEGVEVLVSDGENYDIAWYLMSSEYMWMKTDHAKDTADKYKGITIIKWSYIE